uniref:Uncharacterized protein n=1 Tax=Arundo donax TaxID=35708 RepID=A0A0A9CV58_ARUDO
MVPRSTPCLVLQFSLESCPGGEFTMKLFNTRRIEMPDSYHHLGTQRLQLQQQ